MTYDELIFEFGAENVEQYNDLLDCEGAVTVAGMQYNPSQILLRCDPIAYRCGLIDYLDSVAADMADELED